jgi:hypothetical protein
MSVNLLNFKKEGLNRKARKEYVREAINIRCISATANDELATLLMMKEIFGAYEAKSPLEWGGINELYYK